jgi:hypothetical protein
MTGYGYDLTKAGTTTAYTGNPTVTYGEQVLQSLGMSPQAAGLTYALVGLSPAAVEAYAVNKAVNAAAKLNDAARLSYTTERFVPQGVNVTAEVMNSPQVKAIINEYVAAGVSPDKAWSYAQNLIVTGKSLPTALPVSSEMELIKVVPKGVQVGDTVSDYTPFFMTRQQYDALAKLLPEKVANQLGLPAEQAIRGTQLGFDVYSMKPLPGVTPKVFTSEVAPVQQGGYTASGGTQQVLVPNRGQWTDPNANKIGSISGSR